MRLTPSEREGLRKLQRNLCGSSDYARVTCILMLDNGYSPSAISDCLGIDISTVYRYCSSYLHGGAGELLENRHKGYWGLLDIHQISALYKELREHVYTDSKSVPRWIKATFGVEYTSQGVVDLLNRIVLRKKVINTGFYRTKEEFRRAIKQFFDNIELFKEELESLLTLKFRLANS